MKRLVLNKNGMLLLIISMVISTLLIIGETDNIKVLLITKTIGIVLTFINVILIQYLPSKYLD